MTTPPETRPAGAADVPGIRRPRGGAFRIVLVVLCVASASCFAAALAVRGASGAGAPHEVLVVELVRAEDYGEARVSVAGGQPRPVGDEDELRAAVRGNLSGRRVVAVRVAGGIRTDAVFRVWRMIDSETPPDIRLELESTAWRIRENR